MQALIAEIFNYKIIYKQVQIAEIDRYQMFFNIYQCTETKQVAIVSEDESKLTQSRKNALIKLESNALLEELSHIEKAVENAKYILRLSDNWDDDGALKIPELIFNRAVDFLYLYSKRAFDVFNFVIRAPIIQPVKDGSIDLEWDTEKAFLLINFKNSQTPTAFYYGEFTTENNQKFDFNGEIPTDTVQDTFVSWLKNLS